MCAVSHLSHLPNMRRPESQQVQCDGGAAAVQGPGSGGRGHHDLCPPGLVQRLLAAARLPGDLPAAAVACLLHASINDWRGTGGPEPGACARVDARGYLPPPSTTVPALPDAELPQVPVNSTLSELELNFELGSIAHWKYMLFSQVGAPSGSGPCPSVRLGHLLL